MIGKLEALALSALVLGSGISNSKADELETRGGHCNDTYFGSDGGGITGCLEYGLRLNDDVIGIGIFGAQQEQLGGGAKDDPLGSLSRINVWYGREIDATDFDSFVSVRAGIEGGIADDLGRELQNLFHQLVGENNHKVPSTHDDTLLAGVSGWARKDFVWSEGQDWMAAVAPYGHGALGNDTIEAGGGLMLSLQQSGETEPLALLLPRNGAYAPTFGGDGIGMFAGVRAVARETLYDGHSNAFLAEAGITAQATFFDFAVVGVSGSCTNKPYDGAPAADCKATFQMGGQF